MVLLETAELVLRANRYSGSGDWLDESGNGHDAVATGSPAWDGEKFTISTAPAYFTIPDHADLDFGTSDSFTVIVVAEWAADHATQNQLLIGKGAPFGGPGWWLYLTSGGAAIFRAGDGAGGTFLPSVAAVEGSRYVMSGRRSVGSDVGRVGTDSVFNNGTDNTAQSLANSAAIRVGAFPSANPQVPVDLYGIGIWRSYLSDEDVLAAGDELVAPLPGPDTPTSGGGRGLLMGI